MKSVDRQWRSTDFVLIGANLVYATSYVATRLTLDTVPPATLGLLRCALGAAVLLPLAARYARRR